MMEIFSYPTLLPDKLILITGLIIFFTVCIIAFVFLVEKEYRASRIALITSFLVSLPCIIYSLVYFENKLIYSTILLIIIYSFLFIMLIPLRVFKKKEKNQPSQKCDERDIMFSRNELKEGTEKYNDYYAANPDKKSGDDDFRSKPGLLSPDSVFFHPVSFAAANSNLEIIEALKPIVNGQINNHKEPVISEKISNYIKTWAKKLGAHSAGITELKDYHLYTHKGRGDLYGKEINNNHKYAVAFTIEMDIDMIQSAPKAPAIMESTQQYLSSGTIALQIASFIRHLGYSARAHIDGNYELICPLVARDAGLGEIGRMGLLITPKLGPRVRIAVITTDMPLQTDIQKDFSSVIDFCTLCKKCATSCPSYAIPTDQRQKTGDTLRWKLNSESCFSYWCTAGTDCGKCIAVCPYSHPNSLVHNIIRQGINNSFIFQRVALVLDDFFYGKKPKSRKIPSWIDN